MAYNLERRQSPRKRFEHLLYVEVEPGNGGMVLNFSEHGFGFRAVKRVRPKEEVKFAFNLADQRRLEGRGRLEWTDKEGRVAGLQFTEISQEFRAEMRKWLSTSPEAARSPRTPIQPPDAPPTVEPSSQEAIDRSLALRRRDALVGAGAAKAVRSISSLPTPEKLSTPVSLAPEAEKTPSIPETPMNPSEVPWAAMLPPAVGTDRKPTISMPPRPAAKASAFGGATAFDLSSFEPVTEESLDGAEKPAALEELREPLASDQKRPGATTGAAFQNPIAAVEARTADALNDHAQALLQHFQHEEQRMAAAFRENAARILRDSERQLFPIREGVQAQIKSLESSVASAAASAKVLDQYPSLLERAQQQALDRFQAQMQEILHSHVIELRRRSETVLADMHAQAHTAVLPPHRISTSSGVIVTAIIVALLAGLFMFRREASQGFIWLGQQMVAPSSASEKKEPSAPAPATANAAEEPASTPPPTPAGKIPAITTKPDSFPLSTPEAPRDVHALWADVAKGDVSAEMTLGTMYYTGHGVTKNCYQARRLFSAAARKGNDEAKQKLAELDNGACG
jgi:hypothetical protein